MSERLSITNCKDALVLYINCVLYSLKELNVQLNPVSLFTDVKASDISEFSSAEPPVQLESLTLNPVILSD